MRIVADGATLTVTLKNQRPVELVDLTTSFLALGQAYEDFVYTRGFDPVAGNVRLYISPHFPDEPDISCGDNMILL